jgi:hypothetical protein
LICTAGNLTKLTITGFGILNGPHDYGGYLTYNTPGLAGVRQCRARRPLRPAWTRRLARLGHSYGQAVALGISVNLSGPGIRAITPG